MPGFNGTGPKGLGAGTGGGLGPCGKGRRQGSGRGFNRQEFNKNINQQDELKILEEELEELENEKRAISKRIEDLKKK